MALPTKLLVQRYFDPPISPAEQAAVRAVKMGTATADQQRRAFHWIMFKAAGISSHSFMPGDPYGTHFLEGRRSVGVILGNAIKIDEDEQHKHEGEMR